MQIWFHDLRIRNQAYENTQFVQQWCFFFHYSLATWMTNGAQMFTGSLFYAYDEIHQHDQVGRLVFDNYQRCPVSLNGDYEMSLIVLY